MSSRFTAFSFIASLFLLFTLLSTGAQAQTTTTGTRLQIPSPYTQTGKSVSLGDLGVLTDLTMLQDVLEHFSQLQQVARSLNRITAFSKLPSFTALDRVLGGNKLGLLAGVL